MNRFVLLWLAFLVGLGGCHPILPGHGEIPSALPETGRFPLPDGDRVIGRTARIAVQEGDTLADIARHFGLGLQALLDANPGVDPWLPPAGREVILPLAFILPEAPRTGIVINLAAMRLFHFSPAHPGEVRSYPVGIGREGWETPRGRTRIVQKKVSPSWVVPASIRREHAQIGDFLPSVVPPGPDNPLGTHALRLGFPGYLIHGTNKPYGVGLRISHGCIRLYPEDVAALFPQVSVGDQVTIVDQPYLVGWHRGELHLQVHRPLRRDAKTLRSLRQALMRSLDRIEHDSGMAVDRQKVDQVIADGRGIPLPIGQTPNSWEVYLEQAPRLRHPSFWRGRYHPPEAGPGWYLVVGRSLPDPVARRLVAILNHQGPPLPARLTGSVQAARVVIGPYPEKSQAMRIQRRLSLDLELPTRLLSPSLSMDLMATLRF